MAKVSLTKLGLKVNQDVKDIEFNGQIIEVKQYLPVNDKLELIGNVINSAHDENNFSNPVKVSVFTTLEIMYAYTNINFTEKQKEDPTKLYDMLISSGFACEVFRAIPEEEYHEIVSGVEDSIEAIYTYRNSVLGILDNITSDYDGMNLDATNIYNKLADPDNMDLIK
jgi:hypothetical protein